MTLNIFFWNLHSIAIILVYKTLENDQFYLEKILLQKSYRTPEISGRASRYKSFFEIFAKNSNIVANRPRLLQIEGKWLYFIALKEFYLRIEICVHLRAHVCVRACVFWRIRYKFIIVMQDNDLEYFFLESTFNCNHFGI